ncbi:MAG: SDR family NAD(P)-dependent oxidoreductase [Oligoflexales bacterium]
MDLKLNDKVVVISGSSKGIGLGIAETLLTEKCKVVITGRNIDHLKKAEFNLVNRFGQEALLAIQSDFRSPTKVKNMINQVTNHFGKIDILVCNVGSGTSSSEALPDEDSWESTFQTNLNSAVYAVRLSLPYLEKRTNSNIIFVSSIAGSEVIGAPTGYSVAKSAINSLSKNLAIKLGSKGIRVNTISPGNILFPGGTWEAKVRDDKQKVQCMLNEKVPLGRFGNPREIGDVVAFIASDRSSFITGSNFYVDGGQTISIN